MIGVVLNPNARGARGRGLAARLARIVGAEGEVVETRTPDELARAVARFAERGCDVIATCGGDGTNLSTLTQVVKRWSQAESAPLPRFVPLRGGTVNTVAKNLGIRGAPEEILARVVARLGAGHAVEVGQDLLAVNGMYGFLFAAGMGARFLEVYYGGPVQGVAWASLLAARTVASAAVQGRFARWLFAPVPCTLVVDGERLPIEAARLLLASMVPDVGIGMKVTWRAGRVPGRFHLIASSLPTPKMAIQLDRVLAGRPLQGEPHLDRLARTLELRFATAQTFTLDGELFREQEVRIAVGPRITILKP